MLGQHSGAQQTSLIEKTQISFLCPSPETKHLTLYYPLRLPVGRHSVGSIGRMTFPRRRKERAGHFSGLERKFSIRRRPGRLRRAEAPGGGAVPARIERPGCSRDTAGMVPGWCRDAAGMLPGCSRGCCRDAAGMVPGLS